MNEPISEQRQQQLIEMMEGMEDTVEYFCDKQIFGPYLFWEHTHTFSADGNKTIIRDIVNYKILFGQIFHKLFVKRDLKNIFEYRYKKIEEVFKK